MREINECTAEVFRRSEKRIKERKRNRNRILNVLHPTIDLHYGVLHGNPAGYDACKER